MLLMFRLQPTAVVPFRILAKFNIQAKLHKNWSPFRSTQRPNSAAFLHFNLQISSTMLQYKYNTLPWFVFASGDCIVDPLSFLLYVVRLILVTVMLICVFSYVVTKLYFFKICKSWQCVDSKCNLTGAFTFIDNPPGNVRLKNGVQTGPSFYNLIFELKCREAF